MHFHKFTYSMCAIITRGLYIFYPILEGQKSFLRSFFRKFLTLFMVSIQERVMMTSIRYVFRSLSWQNNKTIHKFTSNFKKSKCNVTMTGHFHFFKDLKSQCQISIWFSLKHKALDWVHYFWQQLKSYQTQIIDHSFQVSGEKINIWQPPRFWRRSSLSWGWIGIFYWIEV